VIIVAAEADYKDGGDQAQVNWGTLVMLPLLVESLAAVVSKHTLVFVAFTGGKGEHSGASSYVQQLTDAQRKRIHAVIELDHIGRTPPSFAPGSHADRLGIRLRAVANALKLEELPRMYFYGPTGAIEGFGPISHAFDSGQIPAITMYSRDHYEPPGLEINGIQKSWRKTTIDPKAYYDTYLLLCMYVRQIDRDLASADAPKKVGGLF
jgi:Zn-dependent M28 family amino/carboxypeptidase